MSRFTFKPVVFAGDTLYAGLALPPCQVPSIALAGAAFLTVQPLGRRLLVSVLYSCLYKHDAGGAGAGVLCVLLSPLYIRL